MGIEQEVNFLTYYMQNLMQIFDETLCLHFSFELLRNSANEFWKCEICMTCIFVGEVSEKLNWLQFD